MADVLWKYGEERFSRRIAKNIVRRREVKAIETTLDLVDAIRESVPPFYRNSRKINCATRTFQALRIAVNDELGALRDGMEKAWSFCKGRKVGGDILSFFGRPNCKNYFKELAVKSEGKIITKKPITPTEEEKAQILVQEAPN